MTEILPCPFCGSTPEIMGSGDGQRGLMIHCIAAGCVNPHVSYYEHASAIAAWNRRSPPATAEPVGYIVPSLLDEPYAFGVLYASAKGMATIPVYTHPAAALTARDRIALADRLEKVGNRLTGDDIAQIVAALRSSPLGNAGLIEQCAKIAEPWAGFYPLDDATKTDLAIIEVRTEIAEKIRALISGKAGA